MKVRDGMVFSHPALILCAAVTSVSLGIRYILGVRVIFNIVGKQAKRIFCLPTVFFGEESTQIIIFLSWLQNVDIIANCA